MRLKPLILYGLSTLLVFTSPKSLRSRCFAFFYGLHSIQTSAMLITLRCGTGVGLLSVCGAGERLWCFAWFLYTNGIVWDVIHNGLNAGNMESAADEKATVERIVPTRATNAVTTAATFVGSDRGMKKGQSYSSTPSESWEMASSSHPFLRALPPL